MSSISICRSIFDRSCYDDLLLTFAFLLFFCFGILIIFWNSFFFFTLPTWNFKFFILAFFLLYVNCVFLTFFIFNWFMKWVILYIFFLFTIIFSLILRIHEWWYYFVLLHITFFDAHTVVRIASFLIHYLISTWMWIRRKFMTIVVTRRH